MNPYEVLGVKKTVGTAELKARYRALSAKYHPDKEGGDRAVFEEVKLAYDVLSNPARRKRYDTTGRIDEDRITPDRVEAFLREMFKHVIEATRPDGSSDDPTTENIRDKIILSLHGSRVPLKNDRFKLQRKLERAVRMLERFKAHGDWDPVGKILKDEKERLEHELRTNQDAMELSLEAEKVIKTYGYNVGPGPEGQFSPDPTGHRLLGGLRR
jgi:curved DNA-binding protein CbpA